MNWKCVSASLTPGTDGGSDYSSDSDFVNEDAEIVNTDAILHETLKGKGK